MCLSNRMCGGAPPTLLQFHPHFFAFHNLPSFLKWYVKGHATLFLPIHEGASSRKSRMTNRSTMDVGDLIFENVFGVCKRLLGSIDGVLHLLKYA